MNLMCAYCSQKFCHNNKVENAPKTCPTKNNNFTEVLKKYQEKENYKIANASAKIVMDNYSGKTRIIEIIDFAKEMEYQKLGLAFCVGLSNEATITAKILKEHGFEVESVVCKIGSINREEIGIKDCDVPMCNPISQAEFLNQKHTDLNIILGLCVGHDTLFFKYSEAPVTVFAVKDSVLAHNPLGAIYQANSYYKNKLFEVK